MARIHNSATIAREWNLTPARDQVKSCHSLISLCLRQGLTVRGHVIQPDRILLQIDQRYCPDHQALERHSRRLLRGTAASSAPIRGPIQHNSIQFSSSGRNPTLSRRYLPELCVSFPPSFLSEGAGKAGHRLAPATRGQNAHGVGRGQPDIRPSRAMVLQFIVRGKKEPLQSPSPHGFIPTGTQRVFGFNRTSRPAYFTAAGVLGTFDWLTCGATRERLTAPASAVRVHRIPSRDSW